MLIKLKNT